MARLRAAATSPVERFFQFSVLGFVASGYLAVVGSGFLDFPTTLLMATALVIRTLYAAGVLYYRIPPRVVTFATIAYVAVYAMDNAWISRSFAPATVHLIFFLAIVKLLTATTARDYFFLKLVAFLELLTACVLSSRLNFFLFLTVFLVVGVATFTSSEIRRSSLNRSTVMRAPVARGLARQLMVGSVLVSFAILILTGGLFFVLPRTARAAFHNLVSSRFHIPGFADSVTLGQIGEIKRSDSPVMHVRMDDAADLRFPLKWRGAALNEFDGRRWYNLHGFEEDLRPDRGGELRLVESRRRNHLSRRISYSVHLKEIASNVLFFAGRPEFMRIDAPLILRSWSGNYRFIYREPGAVAYEVVSAIDTIDGENENDPDTALAFESRPLYLRLPQIDPRISALAHSIVESHSGELSAARAIERYLRTTYGYTLDLPTTEPRDPLANFLFERRKGHCEYFASAMAVMLRTAGIPSRIVTGFGPGVYNPVSGWRIIRASDAHSWVEAYLPLHGWTTFDPTPPDPNPPGTSFWARIAFYLDAADTFWQDWVLNYNLDRQVQLASRVGETGERIRSSWFENIGRTLAKWKTGLVRFFETYGVILVCCVVGVVLIWRFGKDFRAWFVARGRVRKVSRGEARASDATLLYSRMLKLLKNRGIEKPAWLTPLEFARVIPEQELSLLVQDFTDAYNQLRFGGGIEAAPRMMRIIDRLGHRLGDRLGHR
jgi:protein-glutamine gamma-glutamyltransferase